MGAKTLTVQSANVERSYVEAEGKTYQEAKAAAEAQIQAESQAVVIRTA